MFCIEIFSASRLILSSATFSFLYFVISVREPRAFGIPPSSLASDSDDISAPSPEHRLELSQTPRLSLDTLSLRRLYCTYSSHYLQYSRYCYSSLDILTCVP
ncbi:hypothetical protein AC579_2007 [Pseudocercospora musae]|uniref:Uncharacterized protein n=1 Tax=Pseudocercospora musae TaxID=113226 RepID=A0A139IQX7_9PEZI|nr:hypothetical protein AC579_2007 [Pseudocercospora musae]